MPLPIIASILSTNIVFSYITHILLASLAAVVIRAYFQGRKTTRERDLHGRVILLTGGFTSVGLTLLESLARRGAHVIALTSHPIDSPTTSLLIDAVRSSTANEYVFAEQCDLASPSSVRGFCQKFLTGQDTRLDALILAHEYAAVGSFLGKNDGEVEKKRASLSLSTFLMITLLLPPLLVAPAERDVRIITIINPFYAAAIPTLPRQISESMSESESNARLKQASSSTFHLEGTRALRTVVLTRHLQRVLDALPAAPVIDPEAGSTVSRTKQRSNIVAVCVSPGMSRTEVVAPLLRESTFFGWITYFLLQPFLLILTKSPLSTIQTILHALFLPTPFKRIRPQSSSPSTSASSTPGKGGSLLDEDVALPEEILKPGALYAECSVVTLNLAKPTIADKSASANGKEKGKDSDKDKGKAAVLLEDDGEMGGEELGRMVWEQYEAQLKVWEKSESESTAEKKEDKIEKSEEAQTGEVEQKAASVGVKDEASI